MKSIMKKKIDLSMLPNIEKTPFNAYKYVPDKFTCREVLLMLTNRGIIVDDNTFVGTWHTNKDGSISLFLDGEIIIKPQSLAQQQTEKS